MRQQGEASVEEILESIKKVIARDNRATAIETRRRREEDGLNAPEPVSGLESDEDAEEVLDLGVADFVEEAPAENEFHEAVSEDEEDSPLTTDAVRISLREHCERGAPPQIVRSGETSLEGLVREMLRPMLAEWLDRNLPGMVEKMVKAEIARIAGKRG